MKFGTDKKYIEVENWKFFIPFRTETEIKHNSLTP